MSLGILDELNEKSVGVGRPAGLYRFNRDKYNERRQQGMVLEIL